MQTLPQEIEKAIIDNFKINKNGFLYLTVDDVDFEKHSKQHINKDQFEVIRKYCIEQKLRAGAYRKRQKLVFDCINRNNKFKKISNCIYDDSRIIIKEVDSVSSLLKALKLASSKKDVFFRGQTVFGWEIKASIYRNSDWISNEKLLIDEMIQNNPQEFEFTNTFDILSKMQHYELPTRLIDVTTNPLIGLYFCCDKDEKEDGQIYFFNPERDKVKFNDSDTVSVLSNLSKMEPDFGDSEIESQNVDRFIHFIRNEKSYFENRLKPGCLDNYFFVRASLNNRRITKQNGAFILVGCKNKKRNHIEIEESIIINNMPHRFIIPFSKKNTILSELAQLNINSGTIYPEIDSVARYIKNKYITTSST